MAPFVHRPLLDEVSLPEVTRCGLNSPSPDSLTPERAAAMIWTWADGHPYQPYSDLSQPTQLWMMLQDVLRSAFGGAETKVQSVQRTSYGHVAPSKRYRLLWDALALLPVWEPGLSCISLVMFIHS